MLYIQVDTKLINHPKTRRLARLLKINQVQTVGHLVALWSWATEFAPDGDLTKYRNDLTAIADGAMWEGDSAEFVGALVEARSGSAEGFIEADEDGILRLHDWHEYFGAFVERRRKDAERKRLEREAERAVTESDNPQDVQRMSNGQDAPSSVNHNHNHTASSLALTPSGHNKEVSSSYQDHGGDGPADDVIDDDFRCATAKWKEIFQMTPYEMSPPVAHFARWIDFGGIEVLCHMIEQAKPKNNPAAWLWRTYDNWRQAGEVAPNVARQLAQQIERQKRAPVKRIRLSETGEVIEVGNGT